MFTGRRDALVVLAFGLLLACGGGALISASAASQDVVVRRPSLVGAFNNQSVNATIIPKNAGLHAEKCIRAYQPCGQYFHCCPGLQCLPVTNTGPVCAPPPRQF